MQIKAPFFLSFITIATLIQSHQHKPFVLILDPAGDSKKTGRSIGDSFERGITLQCAEKIKEVVEQHVDNITVYITRLPGDIAGELQNASLANRLSADLFISINFCSTTESKPGLYMYQFAYGSDFAIAQQNLCLISYDQAHLKNKNESEIVGSLISAQLNQQEYHSLYTVFGPFKLPFKPLIGVTSPCLAIEAELKNKNDWIHLIQPLKSAIIEVVKNTKAHW